MGRRLKIKVIWCNICYPVRFSGELVTAVEKAQEEKRVAETEAEKAKTENNRMMNTLELLDKVKRTVLH